MADAKGPAWIGVVGSLGGVNDKEGGESSGGRKSEALRKAVEDFLYRNHLPPFRLSDSLVKLGTLLRCHALVERTNIGSLGLRHHGNLARPGLAERACRMG